MLCEIFFIRRVAGNQVTEPVQRTEFFLFPGSEILSFNAARQFWGK
jgi:hypothetical protein